MTRLDRRSNSTCRQQANVLNSKVKKEELKKRDTIAIIKAEDEVTARIWCHFNSPEIWPASHWPFKSALS